MEATHLPASTLPAAIHIHTYTCTHFMYMHISLYTDIGHVYIHICVYTGIDSICSVQVPCTEALKQPLGRPARGVEEVEAFAKGKARFRSLAQEADEGHLD